MRWFARIDGGVAEPDLALDERAHGVDGPADAEQRLAAHGGCVALRRLGQRLRQRREHVERGLRPSLGQLEPREQHGARLLLRDGRAVARFADAPARERRVAVVGREPRGLEQDSRCARCRSTRAASCV